MYLPIKTPLTGGKGKRKGQPLKQGGALAGFSAWFGSMSVMNILYVWLPASWGLSVVEPSKNAMRRGWRRIRSFETHRCLITQKSPWALRLVR